MLYMRPHVSGTECVGFSKQDACGNLVIASLLVNLPFSAFCQRFLVQTSVGLNTNHTFLSLKNPWTDTFLRDLGLAKLRSTARVWNPQEISKLMIKYDCCLSYGNFLVLCSRRCAGLPCYKCFAAGSSTYPCQMACVSKSVTKDVISLSNYVPNSTGDSWFIQQDGYKWTKGHKTWIRSQETASHESVMSQSWVSHKSVNSDFCGCY
jgi:hypothetical protein